MIKVTDYIMRRLSGYGIQDIFMISGGGAMHLVDSAGKSKKIRYTCNHHEQACAIAAEGYFRVSGRMAAVVITSGPGGTNCLTGVIGQWLDSIPCIYISGQVKQETTIEACRSLGLRQLGDQEINIVDIVRPVTKYAAVINRADDVRYHLEKAFYLAVHGRPGPVWLDVPLNIQAALVDEHKLKKYINEEEPSDEEARLDAKIKKVMDALGRCRRPVIVAGHGIRLAQAQAAFKSLLRKLPVPVVSTFCGMDLIDSRHPLFAGRIGTIGDRAGNFALQNADLVLCIGTRNNIRQVSYNWDTFARNAKKIVVDIDGAELKKPTVKPDIAVQCDAGVFMKAMVKALRGVKSADYSSWIDWCRTRRELYPVVLPQYWKVKYGVQPYCFIDALTRRLAQDALVVAGNGTACVSLFQAAHVKEGQRFFWNSGCASMGYDLPAALGASIASGKPVICLAGDGSLQMNIQELQTVKHYNLNIKVFVLNNNGYISIKQTQDSFFKGHCVACDQSCGVSFPDIIKLGRAYGFKTIKINGHKDMDRQISLILAEKGPVICAVKLQDDYIFSPKLSSQKLPDGTIVSKPLEDMYPFLDRAEFSANMINEARDLGNKRGES